MDIVSMVSAFISVVGAALTWMIARGEKEFDTRFQLRDAYLRIIAYRSENPQVVRLSRLFSSAMWNSIYEQENEIERQRWVKYYSYLEYCLIYINLGLSSKNAISHNYRNNVEPLICMLIAENYPAIYDLMLDQYLSLPARDFIKLKEKQGVDWKMLHELLPLSSQDRVAKNHCL